jgi:hypothetical protein
LLKEELAFNDWLIEVKDIDSIQKKNSHMDNSRQKVNHKKDTTLILTDEWHL